MEKSYCATVFAATVTTGEQHETVEVGPFDDAILLAMKLSTTIN